MDGWSRERGRQNEQIETERGGQNKSTKPSSDKLASKNTHTCTQGAERRSGED